ncbi:hypothetical protein NE237_024524 [Protea cynaroides]|uniref:Uncharacterized protein n=1 Tax=Protea cynaroides TaxID=273540 RepID=A0A9Q0H351_9MAGN|nr:hypothetical protein NE237_024524 [Protea cynaroides]
MKSAAPPREKSSDSSRKRMKLSLTEDPSESVDGASTGAEGNLEEIFEEARISVPDPVSAPPTQGDLPSGTPLSKSSWRHKSRATKQSHSEKKKGVEGTQ